MSLVLEQNVENEQRLVYFVNKVLHSGTESIFETGKSNTHGGDNFQSHVVIHHDRLTLYLITF